MKDLNEVELFDLKNEFIELHMKEFNEFIQTKLYSKFTKNLTQRQLFLVEKFSTLKQVFEDIKNDNNFKNSFELELDDFEMLELLYQHFKHIILGKKDENLKKIADDYEIKVIDKIKENAR